MRPEGNEAGESFLNPPALESWRGGFFVSASRPARAPLVGPTGQVCNALEEGLEV
jgi:hypothetical protein